jgi:hypothetical protein
MNCCDDFTGECNQGRDCPVRRQRAYPETLPPELPLWPQSASRPGWRERLANVATAAGYAAVIMLAMGGAMLLSLGFGRRA